MISYVRYLTDSQEDEEMKTFGNNGSRGQTVEGTKCPACSRLSLYIDDQAQWHMTRCGLKNPERLKRIHIVGGPGSGKTTLAYEMGACLGIEVHELDLVAFTGPDYAQRDLTDRLADVSSIVSHPAWIAEGLFILWTDKLLECADIIVWLDQVSWGRSMWRTIQRFTKLALREAKNRRGLGKFTRFHDYARHLKQLINVFFSSRAYYSPSSTRSADQIESRQITAKYLSLYQDKVIHCYRDEGVEAVLNYVYYCCHAKEILEK